MFEYRWHPEVLANQVQEYTRKPEFLAPWRGESLLDKTIVVQAEQGFGDIIMLSRFLPMLKILGAKKVVFLAERSVLQLIGQMECLDVLTNADESENIHGADYWIGQFSLPHYLSCALPYAKNLFPITKNKIVLSEGYLEAEPTNMPAKIGVNWSASKGNLHFIKSVSENQMLDLVGDNCYSFNPETDGPFLPLPDDGWRKNWMISAKHMKACKGIVTVDTGTAHLAGALGVKTIVLLPKEDFICWRWKHGRWYDSVIALKPDDYDQIPELIRRM